MRHLPPAGRLASVFLAGLLVAAPPGLPAQESSKAPPARPDTAELIDGTRAAGRLQSDRSGVVFLAEGGPAPIPWDRIRRIEFDGRGPEPSTAPAPFRVDLGSGYRLSGRFLRLDAASARLDGGAGRGVWTISRAGITAIAQRPGEVQILREGFEALDEARWSATGEPEVAAGRHLAGEKALRLPAGGASVTTRLPTPLGSGRLDLAFWDAGERVAGQRWFVDLTFRARNSDLSTLRVVPGWSEETSAVETPGGPALKVQPLERGAGWHRLSIRFEDERSAVAIDGDDLAHGRGFGGPLQEIRIATEATGAVQPPEGLAAVVDDLRLVRLVAPSGRFEVDPSQDEVRLVTGDQLFGAVPSADAEGVRLLLDDRPMAWNWSEVASLHTRRGPVSSPRIEGLWVEAEWRTAPGDDPRDIDRVEAVLAGADGEALLLDVPYAGRVRVPRDLMTRAAVQGRGARVILDPHAHHLGDRVSPDLDPPRAEAAPVTIPFTLADVPSGAASLLIDAVQVIGEEGTPDYSDLVKRGQLRTTASINERRIDDLNGHVLSRNEAPERLRLAIPPGVLKPGENRLRLDQIGTKDDPNLRDNLGILRLSIEFAPANRPGGSGP